jgi:tetratricopeptide (TPR) repeat protein
MKLTPIALGLVFGSAAAIAPAAAQYASPPPAKAPAAAAEAAEAAKQPKVSKDAVKEIQALQTAVNAKDQAAVAAALPAAQAKAKTADDKYVVGQLQLKAAVDANDNSAMIAGLQAVLNSGYLTSADTVGLYMNLGKLQYNAKQFDPAAAAFEQVLRADPNNLDATVMLAETRNGQGRTAEAVAMIQKAIAAKNATGQKAEESWYKRAVALAYNAKLPLAVEASRQWVAAYPSAKSWRDTIRIYETTGSPADSSMLDAMRLARVTGALTSENDYFRLANTLVTKGYAGEAKAVLEQGFAAKSIDKAKPTFSQLYAVATSKSQGDRESLDGQAKTALATAAGRQAMVTAEAYYGYGDYQKAADLFRAALGKQGIDKDVANLRLGMALAQAGDKAGATAALNAAGGEQAEVAKLWLTYLGTKA